MQYPERFSALPDYAFPRLRALLDQHAPGGEPLAMSIGEPRHPFPGFVTETLARHAGLYARYPPNEGAPELRDAIAGWLSRRYGVDMDPATQILPLNGTREGLFMAVLALCPERKNGERPAILMPNPFYQCYAAAALAAGAEPVYVPATEETGFLPDFAAVPPAILDRAAILFTCSPANPQGAVMSEDRWKGLIALCERHDIRLFADECYSEIWRKAPPPGVLAAARAAGADPERALAFHSLSKRSNLPGLRSGFVAGGPGSIAAMLRLRSYGGAPLPLPAQMAAAAAWLDEGHVEENRRLYREKFARADARLGGLPGYSSPEAGFFLWLAVEDGEAAALSLWKNHGVRVLPGAYLSREGDPAIAPGNPGAGFIRAALVAQGSEIERGLEALAATLETQGRNPG